MREISVNNLNAFVANKEIDEFIADAGASTRMKRVYLAKIILRKSPTHKIPASIPLYAYAKTVGNKLAVKVLTTGVLAILEDSQLASVSEVLGDFSLSGVTYAIKDTVNGFPRYKVKNVDNRD